MGKMNIRERAISVGMLMTGLFLRQVVLISTLRFMLFSILFLMISNMYEKLNNIIFLCLNWCVISIGNQLQSECSGRFLAQSEVFVISFKGQCLEQQPEVNIAKSFLNTSEIYGNQPPHWHAKRMLSLAVIYHLKQSKTSLKRYVYITYVQT